MRGRGFRIDYVGIGLLTLGLGALQVGLDKGQEEDWFDSWFIVGVTVVAVLTLAAAVVWELRHPQPIVNLRLFKDRNFLMCCLVVFFTYGVLYGSTVLLPQMMQSLMGYSGTTAGLVLSPAGLVTIIELPFVGLLLARRVDARWMIAAGLVVIASASWWMSSLSLHVTPMDVIVPHCVQVLGAGLMFVPVNASAYMNVPKEQSNNASALFSLIRSESAGIGVAVVTTLLERQTQFHQMRLIERVNPLNPMAMEMIDKFNHVLG